MNKQEFNTLSAEFLGYRYDIVYGEIIASINGDLKGKYFDPYDDANDMLLLEEKLEFGTVKLSESWLTFGKDISGEGKTPHESRRACAEEYLKEWKK